MVKQKTKPITKTVTSSSGKTWVMIIGIIGIIFSALGVLISLIMIFGGSFVASYFEIDKLVASLYSAAGAGRVSEILPEANLFTGQLISLLGGILLVISIVTFFIYLRFIRFKNWARILVIIFSVLGILFTIPNLFTLNVFGIIILLYNILIFYILTFYKPTIDLFH